MIEIPLVTGNIEHVILSSRKGGFSCIAKNSKKYIFAATLHALKFDNVAI